MYSQYKQLFLFEKINKDYCYLLLFLLRLEGVDTVNLEYSSLDVLMATNMIKNGLLLRYGIHIL